ncbi:MAG: transposase [Clostridia bacterium]|nr:transposase [Clostridia bacterium]
MSEKNELPKRKRKRLEKYNYSSPGLYFVTICTKDRKNLFWEKKQPDFVGEDIILPPDYINLSPYGKIVKEAIQTIPNHYSNIELLQYVIMPNHVHLILHIPYDDGRMISSPTSTVSIIKAVGYMKQQVSKKIGMPIWQRSFHDHVIRDHRDYEEIAKYVLENPIRWQYDCFYNEE